MFSPRKNHRTLQPWLAAAFVTVIIAAAGTASAGLVQDRRISPAQAEHMAHRAQANDDGFPIVVNDLVLKELNRFLGTPEGREFVRASLERMQEHKALIDSKLSEYAEPKELLAIPLVESGYRNLPQSQHKGWGAGLWMFIESTARAFGLRVDSGVDERLNVTAETDAAMRYLAANKLRFGDWQLAILAYNMGEQSLERAIEANGTRDAWTLIRKGVEGDHGYLAKVMAAVLILENPEVVN